MWDDNTEDIFQEITIEQALSSPSPYLGGALLAQMWAQIKLWDESVFYKAMNKHQYQGKKTGTIKFRRYGTYEKAVVRDVNTQTESTLGVGRTFRSTISGSVPRLGDGNFFYLQEGQETENEEKPNG